MSNLKLKKDSKSKKVKNGITIDNLSNISSGVSLNIWVENNKIKKPIFKNTEAKNAKPAWLGSLEKTSSINE